MKVWKFGCNWEGNKRSILEFIHENRIAIGRTDRTPYSIGDLVLICEGFNAQEITQVTSESTSIFIRTDLRLKENNFGVRFEAATIVAHASGSLLAPDRQFEYPVQRGACQVRDPKVPERAHRFWDARPR